MGRRISKEFLHPSILEGVNDKIGNLDSLETDAKDNMVQAINELADKIDTEIAEGKELIANAVGEPLTAEESFDEMSNDINSLLSTFKTNMMNNGITVESNDRFKQLIDKIATMVEEGSGKGIQYAEGKFLPSDYDTEYGEMDINGTPYVINTNLSFTPTFIIMHIPYGGAFVQENFTIKNARNIYVTNLYPTIFGGNNGYAQTEINITNITAESFTISCTSARTEELPLGLFNEDGINWYAIGVGEEDTTLRDSLASILENKGVDVTEEDDMASLITKVDSSVSKSINVVASDDTLCTLYNSNRYMGVSEITVEETDSDMMLCSTLLPYNGSIRVRLGCRCSGNNVATGSFYVVIRRNGQVIEQSQAFAPTENSETTYYTHDFNNVVIGDEVLVYGNAPLYSAFLAHVSIRGTKI